MADLEDSAPLVAVTDLIQVKVKDYQTFTQTAYPLSHWKVRRPRLNYYHHFIVTEINHTYSGTSMVTVLQYTSSEEILVEGFGGIGKCVMETFEVGESISHGLLDYTGGLYFVDSENGYPCNEVEREAAFDRIRERLGENVYHLNWNNCEHLVNYILTGKNASEQVREARCFTDCCSLILSNIKQVGFATAILIPALSAIAGSLVRRAYVRLIVASVVFSKANVGEPVLSNCPIIIGQNIIEEAQMRILDVQKLPDIMNISNADSIIKETENNLNNSLVCHTAEYLAFQALIKMCVASLVTAFGIETIIFLCFLCFKVLPMRKTFLKNKAFCRLVFLRIIGGYVSTLLAIIIGGAGQCFISRPAVAFFCLVLGSGIILRYTLAILAGCVFDSCPKCFCWRCCPHCYGGWRLQPVLCVVLSIIFIVIIMGGVLIYTLY